jgi:hypothetical protein
MRRKSTSSDRPYKFFDIKEVEPERLRAIGAVMLAWNWIEGAIDTSIGMALELHPNMWVDVSSRINGLDGKIAILKESAKLFTATPDDMLLAISKTLNAVEDHKRYRDGVAHVRMGEPSAIVADTAQRRGKTDEILITQEALDALFERLQVLQRETDELTTFFFCRWRASQIAISTDERQASVATTRTAAHDHAYAHSRSELS